jgi:hypothetical protein
MQVTEKSTEAPAHLLAAVRSAIEGMAFDISDDELRVQDRKLASPCRKQLLQETPCEQSVAVTGAMGQPPIIDDEGRKALNDPLLLRELDRNSGRDQPLVAQGGQKASKRGVIPTIDVPMLTAVLDKLGEVRFAEVASATTSADMPVHEIAEQAERPHRTLSGELIG